ncbi:MAG: recombinase family protein [Carnobacterium maltaromaticum]
MINKKRAALYIRVSTQEQANEGYSISAQTERLSNYAKAMDLLVVETYIDPGISGAKLERPALQQMIKDIEKGIIDVVLVYKLDRLSRSQKNTLYLIEDVFLKNNVNFISMNESFDTSTSFGRAMIGILAVFAQLERDAITERTKMGRAERAKDGYYHGGGNQAPFGYIYSEGELIVDEFEKSIVLEIYDMYLKGIGTNKISELLSLKYPMKIKSTSIIKTILRNQLYIGIITFAGKKYDGKHDAIVPYDIFSQVQKIYKSRSDKSNKGAAQVGLLLGKIYCARCGARYFREVTGSKKYRYINYCCYSRKPSQRSMVKDPNCKNKRHKAEALENKVIEQLSKLTIDDLTTPETYNIRDEKSIIQKELSKLDSQLEKIIDLFQVGTLSKESLNDRINKINSQKESLKSEIEKLQKTKDVNSIQKQLESLHKFDWSNEPIQNKIKIIDEFIEKIEIDGEEMLIHWRL